MIISSHTGYLRLKQLLVLYLETLETCNVSELSYIKRSNRCNGACLQVYRSTGVREHCCICGKRSIKPFVASEDNKLPYRYVSQWMGCIVGNVGVMFCVSVRLMMDSL